MNRKEFFARVGFGAAAVLIPACIGGLASSCSSDDGSPSPAPTNVDFSLDITMGALATNGGYLTKNGIVVARTNEGEFLAVSASCTHQGTHVKYHANENDFVCPNHGAIFTSSGVVVDGPASRDLKSYNTSLTGTTLRIYS